MSICPSCGKGTCEPIIKNYPYMIIKEIVTQRDLDLGLFCLSAMNKFNKIEHTTSYYLQKEMGLVGLNFNNFTKTALFLHIPPKGRRTKKEKETATGCLNYSVSEAIKIAKDMKIIFMMGADVTRIFTGYGVSETMGLVSKSQLLPNVPVIVPSPNPDNIMFTPIGELRFALKTLAEQITIYEQYKGE
jgi:hypothetical protein